MIQATHTPGPWRVVTDGISHWIEIEPNKIALIHAKKADRDLIAAAPDLLAALQAIEAYEDNDGAVGSREYEITLMRRQAIAKAKGE